MIKRGGREQGAACGEKRNRIFRSAVCCPQSVVCGLLSVVCIFFLPCRIVFAQEEIIGAAAEALSAGDCKHAECAQGDFFADAVREAAAADTAIIPAYLIKKPLTQGDITLSKLSELTGYGDDTLVLVKVKGDKLKPLFEQSLELLSRDSINFLHVSGLRITYDPLEKPGKRVVLVERLVPWFPLNIVVGFLAPELKSRYASFQPVKPKHIFTLATVKFTAYGPMGYFNVFGDKDIVKLLSVTLQQSLESFVQKNKILSYENENRLLKKPLLPEEEKKEEEKAP